LDSFRISEESRGMLPSRNTDTLTGHFSHSLQFRKAQNDIIHLHPAGFWCSSYCQSSQRGNPLGSDFVLTKNGDEWFCTLQVLNECSMFARPVWPVAWEASFSFGGARGAAFQNLADCRTRPRKQHKLHRNMSLP